MKNSKRILEFLKTNNAPAELILPLEAEIKEDERKRAEWKLIWILAVIVFTIGIIARL